MDEKVVLSRIPFLYPALFPACDFRLVRYSGSLTLTLLTMTFAIDEGTVSDDNSTSLQVSLHHLSKGGLY